MNKCLQNENLRRKYLDLALTDDDITYIGGDYTQSLVAESEERDSPDLEQW